MQQLTYTSIEKIWKQLLQFHKHWRTLGPGADQLPVSDGSQWKSYEIVQINDDSLE
ncbi:hypothetical protein [Paenibacillus sp. FSL H8-0034]|uniref:hypothetical protein n=1 Tax=Paenibacillus sp. FSL H8-0034 TaxID=2954671 RepID=UPI0030F9D42F